MHYYINSETIFRAADTFSVAWHCGNSWGNKNLLSYEVCQSEGVSDEQFLANEEMVFRQVAEDFNFYKITPSRSTVQLHRALSATSCPARSWRIHLGGNVEDNETNRNKLVDYFVGRIAAYMKGGTVKPPVTKVPVNPAPPIPPTTTGTKITLPASADKWGIYKLGVTPVTANIFNYLAPSKFGGLTYNVIRWSQPNVAVIKTGDFGEVQIYVGPETGAIISNGTAPQPGPPTPQPKGKITLPASAATWGVYPLNVQPVTKNISGYLAPAQYGGLTYDVLDWPFANVATIQTGAFGRVNIYVGPDTNAIVNR